MKTPNVVSKYIGLGSLLALVLTVAVPVANAGPGPDYWRRMEKNRSSQPTVQTATSVSTNKACTTSRTEAVTELRSTLPNGKGPVQRVQVGTREVCDSCATRTVVRPALPNGKGPLRSVKVATTHVCDASCDKA